MVVFNVRSKWSLTRGRGYDREKPELIQSEARCWTWPLAVRSSGDHLSEPGSWQDDFSLGFIHNNRLTDLCHKGIDLCGQEHFLTGEKKAYYAPACYSFDSDWQHGLARAFRKHMPGLLHCYPLINFWHTLQHKNSYREIALQCWL